MTASRRKLHGNEEAGFSLAVGGGLSSEPHLALRVPVFVRWNQALPVIRAITEIFRDSDCLRENRKRARMKYLFLKNGWTVESFREALEEKLGYKLDPPVDAEPPVNPYRDHVGVHRQKQEGLYTVGVAVLRGRMRGEQLHIAAELAERFGNGLLRTTGMQNLVFVNIPQHNVDALVKELEAAELRVDASPFWRGTIACSGTEFCKLAITETKGYARWLVEELERRLPGFNQHVKINITGCPNSCGQHWIADVGIEGKKIKVDGRMIDAYYFCVGGAVGKYQGIARPTGFRCPAPDVPEAMERLFRAFLAERDEGESFRQFAARFEPEEIRAILAGTEVEAALRDLPSGPVPQALEA